MSDEIYIQNLRLSAIVGPDAWHRLHKPQPVTLSARLHINTSAAGSSDDIRETVSYGEICKVITACIEGYESFSCIRQLGWRISALAEEQKWGGEKFEVEVILPKGLLRAEGGIGFRCCVVRNRDGQGTEPQWRDGEDFEWLIKDLNLACVIGVNPHERVEKQSVLINLCILSCFIDDYELDHTQDHWQKLVKRNCEVIESSAFETLEALAERIARTSCSEFPVLSITVAVQKPSALHFVDGAGVKITRHSKFYVR
ncbi:MAG: hypothetical protein LQ347_002146 [Umbilicaria vellea]|nr:MAG: hypothetical protein LQ347_002146 [Umbilicaria vellea]